MVKKQSFRRALVEFFIDKNFKVFIKEINVLVLYTTTILRKRLDFERRMLASGDLEESVAGPTVK